MCVSWPYRNGFLDSEHPIDIPSSNAERLQLFQRISSTWGEPFLTIAKEVAADQEIKSLELRDFPPPRELRTNGRAVLMGDSFHAMAMCKFQPDAERSRLASNDSQTEERVQTMPLSTCSILSRRSVTN
jgi:hypothetical protein